MLSPVPWARHILGWMFKAEEFGTKQLLRQLKAANVLSYAAVEDIITTGIVRLSASINMQHYVYYALQRWHHFMRMSSLVHTGPKITLKSK